MEERETTIAIPTMTCGGCARRVDRALRAVDGVHHVVIELPTRSARVRHAAGVERDELHRALADAGYPAAG